MEKLPPDFRAKYEQMKLVIDSSTNQPVADVLGGVYGGLISNPSGGRRFSFANGDIFSFDHTGRFPIVCIYGPIFMFYWKLGDHKSPFGRPLTDILDLSDGSKCCQFEGGHIHSWGDKAEPFPASQCTAPYKAAIPPFPFGVHPGGLTALLHQKWMYLSTQHDPDGDTIIEKLGELWGEVKQNQYGGQRQQFMGGYITGVDESTTPCVVYGEINKLWDSLGAVDSGWGRPLVDEQDLPDGGRCSIFEGGHIHRYGSIAKPFPANQCTAKYKALSKFPVWNGMPPHFQRKWSQLSTIMHPHEHKTIVELLGGPYSSLKDNPGRKGGQNFPFYAGYLVSLSLEPSIQSPAGYLQGSTGTSYASNALNIAVGGNFKEKPLVLVEPFAVYGVMYKAWHNEGDFEGKLGRPLCDEQDLPDGGRCMIFEGGHIHIHNGEAKVSPANQCSAPYQPTTPPVRPIPQPPAPQAPSPPPAQPQTQFSSGQFQVPSQSQYYNTGSSNAQPFSQPQTNISLSQLQTPFQSQFYNPGGSNAKPPSQHQAGISLGQLQAPIQQLYNIGSNCNTQPLPQPQMQLNPSQSHPQSQPQPYNTGNNNTSKPTRCFASIIFFIFGYNIQSKQDESGNTPSGEDDSCCGCCGCCGCCNFSSCCDDSDNFIHRE